MRVALDGREMSVDRPGGLRTYVESLAWSLSTTDRPVDFALYTDRPYQPQPPLQFTAVRVCSPCQLAVREQVSLPQMLKADGIDLAHFPANTAPIRGSVPYVLTLHDTFCVDRPLFSILAHGSLHNKAISLYSKAIPVIAARRARKIVTVSNYSAGRISQKLGIPASEIAVIPQAIHPRYRPVSAKDLREALTGQLGASKLILVIGSVEPRKNVCNAIRGIDLAQKRDDSLGLVMTWPSNGDFDAWADRLRIQKPPRMAILRSVDNEEIVSLYSAVDTLVFVSTDEGFGLPVVEAMACGCPVVTSNTSCLPETAGGAAILVNPLDPEEIAQGIAQVLDDEALRGMLTSRGFERAGMLSASAMAAAMLDLYARCV